MLIKVCAFSISHFYPSPDPLAVEKSAEEGKDVKEEASDKKEKKIYVSGFTCLDHGHLLWTSHLPRGSYSYRMLIGSKPLKTVPTPPPDHLV